MLALAGGGDPKKAPAALVAVLGGEAFRHRGTGFQASLNRDGTVLATSEDRASAVRVWETRTGKEQFILDGHTDALCSIHFDPTGRYLVTASIDKTAKIWDIEKREEIHTLKGHTGTVRAARFSPDGKRVVTASHDKTARIWNPATGEELLCLKGHAFELSEAAFGPDGKKVVTSAIGERPRVWDAVTGNELAVCKVQHATNNHTHAIFSKDGQTVFSTAVDSHVVEAWSAETGEGVLTFRGHNANINVVVLSPDGKTLATGGALRDGVAIRLWDAETGRETGVLRGPAALVYGLSFSADGRLLAARGEDNRAFLWDVATGREVSPGGHTGPVTSVAFNRDCTRLASASDDGTVKVWNTQPPGIRHTLISGPARGVAFSPDGGTLAASCGPKEIKLWDPETGKEKRTLSGHLDVVTGVAFSPDGKWLASADKDGAVKLWPLDTDAPDKSLPGFPHQATCVAFSPDGTQVAAASRDGVVGRWRVHDGSELPQLSAGHAGAIRSFAFRPDGQLLLTGGEDWLIGEWDLRANQLIRLVPGHKPSGPGTGILGLAWAPGGRLVSCAADDTVRVWDWGETPRSRAIIPLPANAGPLGLALTPDGRYVAVAGGHVVFVFRLPEESAP